MNILTNYIKKDETCNIPFCYYGKNKPFSPGKGFADRKVTYRFCLYDDAETV